MKTAFCLALLVLTGCDRYGSPTEPVTTHAATRTASAITGSGPGVPCPAGTLAVPHSAGPTAPVAFWTCVEPPWTPATCPAHTVYTSQSFFGAFCSPDETWETTVGPIPTPTPVPMSDPIFLPLPTPNPIAYPGPISHPGERS